MSLTKTAKMTKTMRNIQNPIFLSLYQKLCLAQLILIQRGLRIILSCKRIWDVCTSWFELLNILILFKNKYNRWRTCLLNTENKKSYARSAQSCLKCRISRSCDLFIFALIYRTYLFKSIWKWNIFVLSFWLWFLT